MTETRVIDGKAIAESYRAEIAAEVRALGIKPGLAVIQVGDHAASEVYVMNKVKAATEAGFNSFRRHLPEAIPESALLAEIADMNKNPAIHGILVQLPLPKHIREEAVIHAISPEKDVDGFHPINIGKLWMGDASALVPCTPSGCIILLKHALANPRSSSEAVAHSIAGKNAVVVGRSNIVGKPMAALLLAEHCTVTLAHSRTENLPEVIGRADIVIAAIGKPEFIQGAWLKPGAVVIDVGINRIEGKLKGDVDFSSAQGIASAITPVPGGVGPMTIACLLGNTLKAAKASLATT